jgi:DNA-binding transcriptional LysR family regulator
LKRFIPKGPVRVLEDPQAVITLAVAGVGVAHGLEFLAASQLQSGKLVEVLSAFRASPRTFSAVYPEATPLGRPARTLLEFMLAK